MSAYAPGGSKILTSTNADWIFIQTTLDSLLSVVIISRSTLVLIVCAESTVPSIVRCIVLQVTACIYTLLIDHLLHHMSPGFTSF